MDDRRGPETAPAADEWQRHAGFLRRLAFGLVGDLGVAEDVLQEAWLASRKAENRHRGRLWLTGVVKNLAASVRRGEARRHSRERRAARPEAMPSTLETTERFEVLQRVVDTVKSLDEPYRSVLLLRFLDELSFEQIARRQGVSHETVRTQVRRGLGLLRRRLDATGTQDHEWLAALLPGLDLARLGIGTAVGTGWTPLLWKGALMGTKTKLTVAFGTLALATWVTWRGLDEGPTAAPVEAERAAEVAVAEVARGESLDSSAPAVASSADTERRVLASEITEWVVQGTLLEGGQGVRGVPVVVRLWTKAVDAFDTEEAPDRELTIDTKDDGGFSCSFEPAEGLAVVSAKPAPDFEGADRYDLRGVQQTVAPGQGPAPMELRLIPYDAGIVGTVRDPAGNPIAGALVRVSDRRATTAVDGSYRFPIVARGRTYVNARAEGYAQARLILEEISAGEDQVADFELREEFRVEGVVRDRFGHPVQGAIVTSFYSHENDAYTDESGRYALHHLDPGRPKHTVFAKKEGWVLTQAAVATEAGGVAQQDFEMDRGVRVAGRIIDGNDEPVEGASLYIGFSPHAFNRLDAVSDADGRFVFPSVQRGPETLVVQRKGFMPLRRVLSIPEDRDRLDGVNLVLSQGHFAGGIVTDVNRDPVEGVWVSVRYRGERLETSGETDEEGRFRLDDLPADQLELSFYAPGRPLQRVKQRLERVDVDDLEIYMPRAGGIAGRVVDDATGEPLDEFRIRFVEPALLPGERRLLGYGASWVREGWRFQDAEGRWDTRGEPELVPGGVVGIEARAEGYAPAVVRRAVVNVDPDVSPILLRMTRGAVVEGVVILADGGEPVADALVKLYREGEAITLQSDDTHGRVLVRTGPRGLFRFEHVAPGAVRLFVSKEGRPSRVHGPFEVHPNLGATCSVELDHGAEVTGTLYGSKAEPRAGTKLVFRCVERDDPGPSSTWTTKTGEDGTFRLEGLPAGRYHVGPVTENEALSVIEYRREFRLEEGGSLELELAPSGSARRDSAHLVRRGPADTAAGAAGPRR